MVKISRETLSDWQFRQFLRELEQKKGRRDSNHFRDRRVTDPTYALKITKTDSGHRTPWLAPDNEKGYEKIG